MVLRLVVGSLAALLALTAGTAITLAVRKRSDRGFLAYFLVLGPALVSVGIELVLLTSGADAGSRGGWIDIARGARMLLGPAWLSFCHLHYKMILGHRGLPAYKTVVALNGLGCLFYLYTLAFPGLRNVQYRTASIILSATLFYAGIMAFAILRISKDLRRSSWSGIMCAGLSMVYYPFIALSEAFGLSFRNFSPEYPLSLQVFPFYLCVICLIIIGFLAADHGCGNDQAVSQTSTETIVPPGLLSPREEDVLRLLLSGLDSAAIADRLCIALSTVKTHTHSVYVKLGFKNRNELLARRLQLESAKRPDTDR